MQTRDEDFIKRLFVASTHTPVLFFSSRGQVYKGKGLAAAGGGTRLPGKASIAPLRAGLAHHPASCRCRRTDPPEANLDVMFATTGGNVRRNKFPTSSTSAAQHHLHEAR